MLLATFNGGLNRYKPSHVLPQYKGSGAYQVIRNRSFSENFAYVPNT